MWQDIRSVYANAWRAAFIFPVLFLIPAIVEFAQHVVEINSGMYLSKTDGAVAADNQMRMLFGFAKTVALGIPGYWFVRFMAFADRSRASKIEWPAFGLWLVLFGLQAIALALPLFGPPLGPLLGLTGKATQIAGPILSGVWSVFGIYLIAWYVAWPLGSRAIGPLRSIRVMHGSFWRTVAYLLGCVVPLMALHYGLSYLAILVTPDWLDWLVLAIDSLVVALLACTMMGASFIAARHAARRKNIPLFKENRG